MHSDLTKVLIFPNKFLYCLVELAEKYLIRTSLKSNSSGKYGAIYLGEEKSTKTQVILKALRKDANSKAVEVLRNEATFSFEFSGLPQILDFYEDDNELILIRKYIQGISVDDYFKSLSRKKRLEALIVLLETLIPIFDELSKKSVVHGDIRPGNLIINPDSSHEVALIDFGLAFETTRPQARGIHFPLGYAAPELLLNQLALCNQRTDQFALGITCWRLLTGSLPLAHPNPGVFTNLQLNHPLPDHDELPKGVYPILARMTSKSAFRLPPNQLYDSEVIDVLRSAIAQRYESLESVVADFKSLKNKSWYLPKNIFSKS